MIPIHELLNRIRWDKSFGQGQFEIGYFDRWERVIQRFAFSSSDLQDLDSQELKVREETGQFRRIPFHRIREVYQDGHLIWQRPG